MLLFVGLVLGKVNSMNIEFLAETFRLNNVYSSLTNQYRYLLSLFIKQQALQSKSLADIDPADSQQHRQLKSIDLGGRCEAQLLRQPLADKENQFRDRMCGHF